MGRELSYMGGGYILLIVGERGLDAIHNDLGKANNGILLI